MTIWGFKRKTDALNAASNARQRPPIAAGTMDMRVDGRGWVGRVNDSGITAQQAGIAGQGFVELYRISPQTSALVAIKDPPGGAGAATAVIKVYNLGSSAIDPGTWVPIWQLNGLPTVGISAGGAGESSPRIQYVIDREYSAGSDNGIWYARALQVDGGSQINPEDPQTPIIPGGEFLVHDPHNQFPYPVLDLYLPTEARSKGATGSIGWAHLRTPTSSGNDPEDTVRWEIESQSDSVLKLRVAINECLLHYLTELDGHFNFDDLAAVSETWPNVDFPRNVELSELPDFEFKVRIYNPLKFTAVATIPANQSEPSDPSYVWVELDTNQKFSTSALETPHSLGTTPPRPAVWNVVAVEKPIARWARVKKNYNGQWEFKDIDLPSNFKEGFAPKSNVVDVACAGVDGPDNCAPEGTEGWAFFKPENSNYEVISTDSALYGAGTPVTVVDGITYDSGCGITASTKTFRGFCVTAGDNITAEPELEELLVLTDVQSYDGCRTVFNTARIKVCASEIESQILINTKTKQVPVVTQVYGSGNSICFTTVLIEVCDFSGGNFECVDICDLLCDCYGNYSQPDFCLPPPPPPCIESPCDWIWNAALGEWLPRTACPQVTDCYCPEPSYPGSIDGEISITALCIDDPPPPPPGCPGTCDDCTNPGTKLRLEELTHTDSGPETGDGCDPPMSPCSFSLGQELSNVGCKIQHYGLWNYQTATGQCSVDCIVTVERVGTRWHVTFSRGTATTLDYWYDGTADCNFFGTTQPGAPGVFGENATLKVSVDCDSLTPAATMQARRRAISPPPVETLGGQFIKANPSWFVGCGCKREVAQIMDRWQSADDVTDQALNTISRTIANKTTGVDLMTIQTALRNFIEDWFNGER